jgi:hypothetical protein
VLYSGGTLGECGTGEIDPKGREIYPGGREKWTWPRLMGRRSTSSQSMRFDPLDLTAARSVAFTTALTDSPNLTWRDATPALQRSNRRMAGMESKLMKPVTKILVASAGATLFALSLASIGSIAAHAYEYCRRDVTGHMSSCGFDTIEQCEAGSKKGRISARRHR